MNETKKLKIGILTFWWSQDNYGQIMQCYALQKYLQNKGHDVYLIRYDSTNDHKKTPFMRRMLKVLNPYKLIKFLIFKIHNYRFLEKQKFELTTYPREFDDFRKGNLKYTDNIFYSYNELKENPPEADVYIVGSDQVWNFGNKPLKRCRNLVHSYFLDFGSEKVKRVAYSASWGKTEISKEFMEEIKPLLNQFDYVSVRELTGIDVCKKCGYEKAEVRCDPTLLHSAEEYRALYKKYISELDKKRREYVLVYRLSNPCDFEMEKIYKWAELKNLEVVYVTGNSLFDKYSTTYATIPQWLSLIDNASYIITNSFHCCVFSFIFRKKFGVIPLSGTWSGMNSRIENLFELFSTSPRWFNWNFETLDEDLNPYLKIQTDFNLEELINV